MNSNGWKSNHYMPVHSNDTIYALNGFTAQFRNYYMVILGQMPMDKALKLYNSVDKSLEIRLNGHGSNISPVGDVGSNKEVMRYVGILLDSGVALKDLDALCRIKQTELKEANPEDFFIETYHIDTWEGFRVFSQFIIDNEIKSTWFD